MIDPVSNNKVPPGAAPEEVRDEHDAKLSTGEYVLPADVVRYLGVEKIEALVSKAKEALSSMAGEDLPFSAEELQTSENSPPPPQAPTEGQPLKMAAGGLVMNPLQKDKKEEGMPLWMVDNPAQDGSDSKRPSLDGTLAGSVDTWKPETFSNYAKGLETTGNKLMEGFISSVVPFGKVALEHRYNYLNEAVPENLQKMITTGKDLQGNVLTEEQLNSLRDSQARIQSVGEVTPNGNMLGAIVEPVSKALGVDKFIEPVKKVVDTVKSPVKEFKKAITEPVKETLKKVGEDVGSSLIGRQRKSSQEPEQKPEEKTSKSKDDKDKNKKR